MILYALMILGLSCLLTAILVQLFRPIAKRFDWVDQPNARKLHQVATPLVGGISIFIAFFLVLLMLPVSLDVYRYFILGSFLLIFTGLVDDIYDISAKIRLLVQVACALLVVIPNHLVIQRLGYIGLHRMVVLPYEIGNHVGNHIYCWLY